MRNATLLALATMLAAGPAFAQSAETVGASGPKPAAAAPSAHPVKQATASTPESRSAAALALTHEPTFDEGTAARIKEAALSYGDIAVRGGWPMIPSDAKFALGSAGPNDELLRRRLIISEDLPADK